MANMNPGQHLTITVTILDQNMQPMTYDLAANVPNLIVNYGAGYVTLAQTGTDTFEVTAVNPLDNIQIVGTVPGVPQAGEAYVTVVSPKIPTYVKLTEGPVS